MKKLLFIAAVLALGNRAMAQTYSPVAVTGYNADVVANGSGTVLSSTTHDVDGVNYNFVALNFVNPASASPTTALPNSGTINSVVASTPGLTYQLAPYTGNNSLRINGTGTGTLTFPAGIYADQVFVLATTGSGTSNTIITVTFTDNTTQVFNQVVSDWYDATGFAIQGISRVNRTNDAIENSTTNPRLYQYLLQLNQANTTRTIQSITFNKTNSNAVLNVMGISVRSIAAPAAVDAGILAVVAPTSPVMQNVSVPVQATLVNQGTSALTAATLTWTVDGVAQPNVAWTGNLALNQTTTVSLGNFTFTPGSRVVNVCVTNPNGTTDAKPANDCSQVTLNSCNVLSGNYTIDKTATASPTTFVSIASAVAAMSSCGVSGPVTFTLATGTGPYTEQVEIPAIAGASATNTITFNGNGNTLSADPVSATRAIFKLNGANYVKLDNFTISATGTGTSSYGWGIQFLNGADNNTISNNTINIGSLSTTESNSAGIVFSNSTTSVVTTGNNGNNNVISGNTITGGYSGIVLYGQAASTGNNQIINNTIKDFYYGGIKVGSANGTLIENNNISRPTRPTVTTFAGVELNGTTQGTVISKNRIHTSHGGATTLTGTVYGVYSNSNDAPAGNPNIVKNNLVYNIGGTSTVYGIYNIGSDGVYYYHNTLNLDNAANTGTVRGFYQTTTATNIRIMNNIISIVAGTTGAKHPLYFGTTASSIRSNQNDLYLSGGVSTSGIGFYSSNRVLLADWQTASSTDSISVSVDPAFTAIATGNFLPTATALNNIGLPVMPAVTDDITGALRNPLTPDPGAYEIGIFTPSTTDAGVTAIVAPSSGCGLTAAETITITVQNSGTAALSSIPVSYTINAGMPVNEIMTGPLAAGASANYSFAAKANLASPNTYNIVASANVPGDAVPANNSFTKVVVSATAPGAPVVTLGGPSAICAGGSLALTVSAPISGATYQWFNNTNPITGATSSTYTATAAGSYTVTANLAGCSSATSAATVVTVTPLPSVPVVTAGGATSICTGGSVTLTAASATTGATFIWSLNGTVIPGATAATYPAMAAGNYTATANSGTCASAASTPMTITVNPLPATPTITQNGFVLTSSSATGNQWFLNNNPISGATNQNYTTTANGSYTVKVTASNCTSAASAPVSILNTGLNHDLLNQQVQVYPNPSKGQFNLVVPEGKAVEVTVSDLTGKVLLRKNVHQVNSQLNLEQAAKGIYLLQLTSENGTATRKLVVE